MEKTEQNGWRNVSEAPHYEPENTQQLGKSAIAFTNDENAEQQIVDEAEQDQSSGNAEKIKKFLDKYNFGISLKDGIESGYDSQYEGYEYEHDDEVYDYEDPTDLSLYMYRLDNPQESVYHLEEDEDSGLQHYADTEDLPLVIHFDNIHGYASFRENNLFLYSGLKFESDEQRTEFLDVVDSIIDTEFPFKNERDKGYAHRVIENTRKLDRIDKKIQESGVSSLSEEEINFVFAGNMRPGSDHSTRYGNSTLFCDGKKQNAIRKLGLKTYLEKDIVPDYYLMENFSAKEVAENIELLGKKTGSPKEEVLSRLWNHGDEAYIKNFNRLQQSGVSTNFLIEQCYGQDEIFNNYKELHNTFGYTFDFKDYAENNTLYLEDYAYDEERDDMSLEKSVLDNLDLFISAGCTPKDLNRFIPSQIDERLPLSSTTDKYLVDNIGRIINGEMLPDDYPINELAPYLVKHCEDTYEAALEEDKHGFPHVKVRDGAKMVERLSLFKGYFDKGGEASLIAGAFRRGEFYENRYCSDQFTKQLIDAGMDIKNLERIYNGGYEYVDGLLVDNLPRFIAKHRENKEEVDKALDIYSSSHHFGKLRENIPNLLMLGVSKERLDSVLDEEWKQKESSRIEEIMYRNRDIMP